MQMVSVPYLDSLPTLLYQLIEHFYNEKSNGL